MTVASDQYALGLILFELITLTKAVQRGKTKDMLRRAQRGQIAPIVHYNPAVNVAPELQAIIHKACAFMPENRYDTVEDLADDIRRYMRDEPISVYKDPPLTVVMRWVSNTESRHLPWVYWLSLSALQYLSIHSLASRSCERKVIREQEFRRNKSSQ